MKHQKITGQSPFQNQRNIFIALSIIAFTFGACKKNLIPTTDSSASPVPTNNTDAFRFASQNPPNFRVVGFYSTDWTPMQPVDYSLLSHVILCFSPSGPNVVPDIIRKAHNYGVKVLQSIAPPPTLFSASHQNAYVDSLVKYTLKFGMDGIDVDIEGNGNVGTSNYQSFVIKLAAALHAKNEIITVDVDTYSTSAISNKSLAQFDFINLMSYGGLTPMKTNTNYFINHRHIPKAKTNLGVYNTAHQMANFTNYAVENSGGMMIWELNQDNAKPVSYLSQINSAFNAHVPVFETQPVAESVKLNGSVTFTAYVGCASPKYAWQKSTDNGATWANIESSHTEAAGSYTTGTSNIMGMSESVLTIIPKTSAWTSIKWRLGASAEIGSSSSNQYWSTVVYSNPVAFTITK